MIGIDNVPEIVSAKFDMDGLSPVERFLMGHIDGACSVATLALLLGSAPETVAGLINGLVARGVLDVTEGVEVPVPKPDLPGSFDDVPEFETDPDMLAESTDLNLINELVEGIDKALSGEAIAEATSMRSHTTALFGGGSRVSFEAVTRDAEAQAAEVSGHTRGAEEHPPQQPTALDERNTKSQVEEPDDLNADDLDLVPAEGDDTMDPAAPNYEPTEHDDEHDIFAGVSSTGTIAFSPVDVRAAVNRSLGSNRTPASQSEDEDGPRTGEIVLDTGQIVSEEVVGEAAGGEGGSRPADSSFVGSGRAQLFNAALGGNPTVKLPPVKLPPLPGGAVKLPEGEMPSMDDGLLQRSTPVSYSSDTQRVPVGNTMRMERERNLKIPGSDALKKVKSELADAGRRPGVRAADRSVVRLLPFGAARSFEAYEASTEVEDWALPESRKQLLAYYGEHIDTMTYYDLLGVSPTAKTREIRSAWAERVAEFQPERSKSGEGGLQQRLQHLVEALNLAWWHLSHPSLRREYDEQIKKSGEAQ